MLNSIVHIESSDKSNKSFGTGFVIDNDEYGAYILTCQHVLEEVGLPVIEDEPVEVVAQSDFLDMAVIHVHGLQVKALPLQTKPCNHNHVHAVAFATFSNDLVQKKQIQATLFDEVIELHSKVDDAFYVVRRVKANKDYTFQRGNSGAPLFCKESGAVIGMISNKEGSDIAYAMEIASLQEIWKNLKNLLLTEGTLQEHEHFYNNIHKFTNKLKERFREGKEGVKEVTQRLHHMSELQKERRRNSRLKYYFLGVGSVLLLVGFFYFFTLPPSYKTANYKVVNIQSDDVLNIREGKGTVYDILGFIPYNAHNVAVTTCGLNDEGNEWCQVTYGSITGWVHSRYIEKEEDLYTNVNRENKNYFRAKHDNLFLQFTYPPSIKRDETLFVTALLENQGKEEEIGNITLSFPQRPLLDYVVDYNDFSSLKQYKIFDEIYNNHKNQEKTMHAIHPMLEALQHNWKPNDKHIFALAIVVPKDLNVFRIRVRGTLSLQRIVPDTGTIDQQAFASEEIVIRIED